MVLPWSKLWKSAHYLMTGEYSEIVEYSGIFEYLGILKCGYVLYITHIRFVFEIWIFALPYCSHMGIFGRIILCRYLLQLARPCGQSTRDIKAKLQGGKVLDHTLRRSLSQNLSEHRQTGVGRSQHGKETSIRVWSGMVVACVDVEWEELSAASFRNRYKIVVILKIPSIIFLAPRWFTACCSNMWWC